jgi:hypothetical protein
MSELPTGPGQAPLRPPKESAKTKKTQEPVFPVRNRDARLNRQRKNTRKTLFRG